MARATSRNERLLPLRWLSTHKTRNNGGKRMTTTVLLRAWANDEGGDLQPDHAVVQVDPDYARYLLDRMDLAQQIQHSHGDLFCIEFYDYAATWYECDGALWELCDQGGVTVPGGDLPENLEEVAVSSSTVRIGSHDACWVAYLKHANVEMETTGVERELFERIARGEEGFRWSSHQDHWEENADAR
jgi:hypothetical protein